MQWSLFFRVSSRFFFSFRFFESIISQPASIVNFDAARLQYFAARFTRYVSRVSSFVRNRTNIVFVVSVRLIIATINRNINGRINNNTRYSVNFHSTARTRDNIPRSTRGIIYTKLECPPPSPAPPCKSCNLLCFRFYASNLISTVGKCLHFIVVFTCTNIRATIVIHHSILLSVTRVLSYTKARTPYST